MKKILFVSLIALLFFACKKDDVSVDDYTFVKPAHFPPVEYPLETNPITKEGFDLGKKLFNDARLSIDNSVACSNCHVKGVAFTDPQHNPSVGVFERSGTRNAPTIANMAFQKEFLWDGGVSHLDFVPVFAIENVNEMAETLNGVVTKLNNTSDYPALFQSAFPEIDTITSPYMLKALSQYMLLLISADSKYDQVVKGEAVFTENEMAGQTLFNQKCATCHSGELFTNQDFMNNGLDTVFVDIGRALISETDSDIGKFKVPSLRNITLTPPYMHDGRLESLEAVLEHYQQKVLLSESLAPELNQNGQLGIPLTESEKQDIISFLETLTDYDFISNPKF
jgi:cytochrome c peroxidase